MNDDDRVLRRVRALLAKAESTEFEEEALALSAKAHELMTAHAIDRILLQSHGDPDTVTTRLVPLAAPYARQKYLLLAGIARAGGCRAILGLGRDQLQHLAYEDGLARLGDDLPATVVGHERDLDGIELLFTSLLVQATNVMLAARPPTGTVRSFRHAFLVGFAETIRRRLAEGHRRMVEAASGGSGSVLPVLASRDEGVEAAIEVQFPQLRTLRTTVSNPEGLHAGHAAGRRADVGSDRLGTRPTLPA